MRRATHLPRTPVLSGTDSFDVQLTPVGAMVLVSMMAGDDWHAAGIWIVVACAAILAWDALKGPRLVKGELRFGRWWPRRFRPSDVLRIEERMDATGPRGMSTPGFVVVLPDPMPEDRPKGASTGFLPEGRAVLSAARIREVQISGSIFLGQPRRGAWIEALRAAGFEVSAADLSQWRRRPGFGWVRLGK